MAGERLFILAIANRLGRGCSLRERVWQIDKEYMYMDWDTQRMYEKKYVKIICSAIKNLLEVLYPFIAQYIQSYISMFCLID